MAEEKKKEIREEDVMFVEANWKMELLHNVWFGMCSVQFAPPYSHLNFNKGFTLANPTHFRCATLSCIMALEIVTTSSEVRGFLSANPDRLVVVYHSNAALNTVLHCSAGKRGLVKRLQTAIDKLPKNIQVSYFKEDKEEAKRAVSIKTGESLMNSHTVVFEDPKKYKEEQQKMDKTKAGDTMSKVQHVREQDLLLGQLLASGAKAGRCVRRPKTEKKK